MIEEIQLLIDNKEYKKALELTEKALSKKFNLYIPEEEKVYEKLLQYRITLHTHLDMKDEYIRNLVRNEKYPSEKIYCVDQKYEIKLTLKGNILVKSDAYVNTVSVVKPFEDASDRSATIDFVKLLLNILNSFIFGIFSIILHLIIVPIPTRSKIVAEFLP